MHLAHLISPIYLASCVYYVVVGISIYSVDKNMQSRRSYILTKICLATWAFANCMMILSNSEVAARVFWGTGFLAFCVFLPFWTDFLYHLTECKSKFIRILINIQYVTSVLATALCISSGSTTFIQTDLGYLFLYTLDVSKVIALTVISISIILILFLQFRWVHIARSKWQRRQAIIFTVMMITLSPPAFMTDMIIPIISDTPIPPLASVILLFITIPLNAVVRRQRMLNITAHDIADDLFSSVNQPILALNYNNNVALANKAAERFWQNDIAGKNIARLIMVNGQHPDQSFFSESFMHDDGITVKTGSGIRDCSILLSVVKNKGDDVLSKIIIFNDITDLKEALYKANEASRAKTDFLARISHEIRTPLNAVIGLTELALREEHLSEVKEHIYTVKQAGSNLMALINDVLDFSKIEADKVDIVNEDYSVSALINDVVSLTRAKLVDTQVRFIVNADSNIPMTLHGDETRIRQAVLNILSNAVKYSDKGHVALNVYMMSDTDGNTTLDGDAGSVNIVFEVKDTGRGIKPEDIIKLKNFSDFTQFDTDKNKSIEGVGLGLAITKSIVDMMGGHIDVTSVYGKGSTFSITLPQRYRIRTPLASVKDPDSKKVLVYERRDIYVMSLEKSFSNLGVDCVFAVSEDELFDNLRGNVYSHLFITYELFRINENEIQTFAGKTVIVVLAEFGEMVSLEGVTSISKPVYCTLIADILNGVHSKHSHMNTTQSIAEYSAPKARVLVVDDIKTNLKVTQGALKPYGMRVDLCDNALAAIDAVRTAYQAGPAEYYDLIFMDHKMPGIDGIEATKRIRALAGDYTDDKSQYFKDVPIIALTANAIAGIEEQFIKGGLNGFLSKPINAAKLNAVLEKWISRDKRKPIRRESKKKR